MALAYIKSAVARGRAWNCRLRGPGFETCAAVLKPNVFILHCSNSLSRINEYLAIDKLWIWWYEQPSRINCSIWLDAS